MISLVEFETPIAGLYLRNNRSSLQKSIRCFPTCGIRGHVNMGFCGLPLRVRVRLLHNENDSFTDGTAPHNVYNCERYIYYAEIRPLRQGNLSALDQITERELIQNTRTKNMNEKGEIFLADFPPQDIRKIEGGEEFSLLFNSEKCSYDYGWRSNRWSGPLENHVVDIICMQERTTGIFKICSYCFSSPFVIVSSHKRNPGGKKSIATPATIKDVIDTELDEDSSNAANAVSSSSCVTNELALPTKRKRARKALVKDAAADAELLATSSKIADSSHSNSNSSHSKRSNSSKSHSKSSKSSSSSNLNQSTNSATAKEDLEIANVLMSISYCNNPIKYIYDTRRLQEIATAAHLFQNCNLSLSKSARVFTTSQMESVLNMPSKRLHMDGTSSQFLSRSLQSSEHSITTFSSSHSTVMEGDDGAQSQSSAGNLPLHNLILAAQQFKEESTAKC